MKKDIEQRIEELRLALKALQNANNHFNKTNDDSYLLTLSGQLRALIVIGGSNMSPLLINLSKELNITLEFYSIPPKQLEKDLVAYQLCGKTWAVKSYPKSRRYNLEEWLEVPAYFIMENKEFRTRNQVLKHIANKEGGSHYDEKTSIIIQNLKSVSQGNDKIQYNGQTLFLLDVAALTYWLGTRLIYLWECRQQGKNQYLDDRIIKLDKQFDELRIGFVPFAEIAFYG